MRQLGLYWLLLNQPPPAIADAILQRTVAADGSPLRRDNPLQAINGPIRSILPRFPTIRGVAISMRVPLVVCHGCHGARGAAAARRPTAAQARGREVSAKPVKVEPVRQETVHRTVEVVGTLAAVDQVTISSEADGKVSRILADLGDRVTAGQALIRVDREKQQYNLDQQKATLARALAQYGATDPQHLPDDRADARRAEGQRRARAGQAVVRPRRASCIKRQLVPKQTLDDADATLQSKQASYDLVAAERRRTCAPSIDASDASDEARRSPAARHRASARRSTATSRSASSSSASSSRRRCR